MMTFFMIVAILVVGFFALTALLAVFGEDDPSPLSSADRERATPSERQFAAALSGIVTKIPTFSNRLPPTLTPWWQAAQPMPLNRA